MNSARLIESSYLARYLLLNSVDISDYTLFAARDIQHAAPDFHFSASDDQAGLLAQFDSIVGGDANHGRARTLDQFLERSGTTAFLVIQHDKLLLENYYNGHERASICTSFSTVKSFVSALIGIALHERLIDRLDDPLTRYLPQLAGPHWPAITVRHLVAMSSGLQYDLHGFLPWQDEPRTYYSPDLRKLAAGATKSELPGLQFHYNNYNLILLGMILERVSGTSVSEYLQEKIWKPLGMEYAASWSLDSRRSGMEKMESGLNACAVDYARFGRLYLRRGDWNGRQIIPESWVVESTTVGPDAKWTNYKYLWWIPRSAAGRFMAVGNLGQFIYVAPDKDCMILRFGRGKPRNWQSVYPQLFGALLELL